jgi:16S rRNA (guanine527-N7)-methyltransferase
MREELAAAASASGVSLEARVSDACVRHFELLLRWNAAHNLTRVTDPAEAARKHYLDCLVPLLAVGEPPSGFVDIGSGAGFPGLLAALLWPMATAVLVEPSRKRASFLVLAAAAMGLSRVRVEPPAGQRAPLVLSRATFSAGERRPLGAAALESGSVWLWGTSAERAAWEEEVRAWPEQWSTSEQPYHVDGLAQRCLLVAARRD